MESPTESPVEARYSWRQRFSWAFAVGAVPMFAWCYLGDGRSLVDTVAAAITVGAVFGILAALFGKRVFDFFMRFPW
jgi:hypothetical protein